MARTLLLLAALFAPALSRGAASSNDLSVSAWYSSMGNGLQQYQLAWKYQGTVPANSIHLTDQLIPGDIYSSSGALSGPAPSSVSVAGNFVDAVWNGPIAPGSQGVFSINTFVLVGALPLGTFSVANTACMSNDQPDGAEICVTATAWTVLTATITRTISFTPSHTPSPAGPAASPSLTITRTVTPTASPSKTDCGACTATSTSTPYIYGTQTAAALTAQAGSGTMTPSLTITRTVTPTASPSKTFCGACSATSTSTPYIYGTQTSAVLTAQAGSGTMTPTRSSTRTATPSPTPTVTPTATPTRTFISGLSATRTPGPQPWLQKILVSGNGQAGSQASYVIQVNNPGPGPAMMNSLWDTLPAGTAYASASLAPNAINGNVLSWNNLASIPAGSTLSITLNLDVLAQSDLCNRASFLTLSNPWGGAISSNWACLGLASPTASPTRTPSLTPSAHACELDAVFVNGSGLEKIQYYGSRYTAEPSGWEQPGFDDSGWAASVPSQWPHSGCWTENFFNSAQNYAGDSNGADKILARCHFSLPAGAEIYAAELKSFVDDQSTIWINGQQVQSDADPSHLTECENRLIDPALLQEGDNVLTLRDISVLAPFISFAFRLKVTYGLPGCPTPEPTPSFTPLPTLAIPSDACGQGLVFVNGAGPEKASYFASRYAAEPTGWEQPGFDDSAWASSVPSQWAHSGCWTENSFNSAHDYIGDSNGADKILARYHFNLPLGVTVLSAQLKSFVDDQSTIWINGQQVQSDANPNHLTECEARPIDPTLIQGGDNVLTLRDISILAPYMSYAFRLEVHFDMPGCPALSFSPTFTPPAATATRTVTPSPTRTATRTVTPTATPSPTQASCPACSPTATPTPAAPSLSGCLASGDSEETMFVFDPVYCGCWEQTCAGSKWVAPNNPPLHMGYGSQFTVTRHLFVPAGADLALSSFGLHSAVDDDIEVFVNGTPVFSCFNDGSSGNCARDNAATLPSSAFVVGDNSILIRVTSRFAPWWGLDYSLCYDLAFPTGPLPSPTATRTVTPTATASATPSGPSLLGCLASGDSEETMFIYDPVYCGCWEQTVAGSKWVAPNNPPLHAGYGSQFTVSRQLFIPAGADLSLSSFSLHAAVDDDIEVFVNGTPVFSCFNDGFSGNCARDNGASLPSSAFVLGDNSILIRVTSRFAPWWGVDYSLCYDLVYPGGVLPSATASRSATPTGTPQALLSSTATASRTSTPTLTPTASMSATAGAGTATPTATPYLYGTQTAVALTAIAGSVTTTGTPTPSSTPTLTYYVPSLSATPTPTPRHYVLHEPRFYPNENPSSPSPGRPLKLWCSQCGTNPARHPVAHVYSIAGRKLRSLECRPCAGEEIAFEFDGQDHSGDRVASGVYPVIVSLEDGRRAGTVLYISR